MLEKSVLGEKELQLVGIDSSLLSLGFDVSLLARTDFAQRAFGGVGVTVRIVLNDEGTLLVYLFSHFSHLLKIGRPVLVVEGVLDIVFERPQTTTLFIALCDAQERARVFGFFAPVFPIDSFLRGFGGKSLGRVHP